MNAEVLVALAVVAVTPAVPTGAPPPQFDVWHMLLGSGWVVRLVLLLLVGYSVGCWGIAMGKTFELRRARAQSARFIDIFWEAKNLGTIHAASVDLKESPV